MIGKSDEEINQLLVQLKERLEDVIAVDKNYANYYYLYRWLIKNQMKVDRTEAIIREAIVWRKENNVDELMNSNWSHWAPGIKQSIQINYPGCSKLGQPVSTIVAEDLNLRALYDKYGKEAVIKFHIQSFAKAEKSLMEHFNKVSSSDVGSGASAKVQKSISDSREEGCKFETGYNSSWYSNSPINISSYKNFSMRNIMYADVLLEVARIGMTYFPECVNAIYVVNLNRFAITVLKLIKPIIKTDSHKLEFFDTDKDKWSKLLLEQFDADQLQPYFGGTNASVMDK